MAHRLAVTAVVAAHGRLDQAGAAVVAAQDEQTVTRMAGRRERRGRGRRAGQMT